MHRFAPVLVAAAIVACAAGSARAAGDGDAESDRIFGILPNYTTVDTARVPKQTTRESFTIAGLSTFDPAVYPFIGLTTALGQGSSGQAYGERYATAFADNAMFSRLAYAASRSVVTRTRSGTTTFNVSEVAGTAAAAGLSNIYYSPADRTAGGTLTRWGTQMMWDTVANELKEFWPDIRARFRKP